MVRLLGGCDAFLDVQTQVTNSDSKASLQKSISESDYSQVKYK